MVTVAPVSTRVRGIPAEVPLGPAEGLPRPCAANRDSITTMPRARLLDRISLLSLVKLAEFEAAIHFALDLST
jgi:mRNA interferase MazF